MGFPDLHVTIDESLAEGVLGGNQMILKTLRQRLLSSFAALFVVGRTPGTEHSFHRAAAGPVAESAQQRLLGPELRLRGLEHCVVLVGVTNIPELEAP